jgi:hypothetical protein
MAKKHILYLTLLSFLPSFGQYTDIINSNQPGHGETAYAVGLGIYQFEYQNEINFRSNIVAYNSLVDLDTRLDFRMGFLFENLELHGNINYDFTWVNPNSIFPNYRQNASWSRSYFGIKMMVFAPIFKDKSAEVRSWKKRNAFDYKRLIPSVGIEFGYEIPLLNKDPENLIVLDLDDALHPNNDSQIKTKIALQQNLSNRWTTIINIDLNDFKFDSYVLSSNYILSDNWAGFIEYNSKSYTFPIDGSMGLGIAYLVHQNLQLNFSGGTNLVLDQLQANAILGVSWRINRHKEYKRVRLKSEGEEKSQLKGKNFFDKNPNSYQKRKKRQRKEKKKLEKIRKNQYD